MSQSVNIREIILNLLEDMQQHQTPCQAAIGTALSKYQYLDKKDRSMISRITRGTIERRLSLDWVIGQFSSVKISRIKPLILNILRMSVYQLLFMDSIPAHAVCNEAVRLSGRRGFNGLKGYVNGVLRNIDRRKDTISLPDKNKTPAAYLSVAYSVPEWMVLRWLAYDDFDTVQRMLAAFLEPSPVTVRINTDKITVEDFWKKLAWSKTDGGLHAVRGHYVPYAAKLEAFDHLTALDIFKEGLCVVQDESSMLAGMLAGIRNGSTVIDLCAAPGGKSMNAALLGGHVDARDISEAKIEKISENLKRTGIKNIRVQVRDASMFYAEDENSADVVIADVPCSGLGILGKKPDIKYRISAADIDALTVLQREIIASGWRYVKPGGTLMYSTCTVSRAENEAQLQWMTENFPLEPVDFYEQLPKGLKTETARKGYIQLMPGRHHCDGFFIARLRRKDTI